MQGGASLEGFWQDARYAAHLCAKTGCSRYPLSSFWRSALARRLPCSVW
jgi:hypothetical protein